MFTIVYSANIDGEPLWLHLHSAIWLPLNGSKVVPSPLLVQM